MFLKLKHLYFYINIFKFKLGNYDFKRLEVADGGLWYSNYVAVG